VNFTSGWSDQKSEVRTPVSKLVISERLISERLISERLISDL
jgi:hypothetical protein